MTKTKMVNNLNRVVTEMTRRQSYCQRACQKIGSSLEIPEVADMFCNLCARSADFYLRRQPLVVQVHYNAYVRAMEHQSRPLEIAI